MENIAFRSALTQFARCSIIVALRLHGILVVWLTSRVEKSLTFRVKWRCPVNHR